MLFAAIAVFLTIVYIVIGGAFARAARPALIAQAFHYEGEKSGYDLEMRRVTHWESDGINRTQVHDRVLVMTLCWPIYSWVLALQVGTDNALDQADPAVAKRLLRKTAAAERELGMT